METESRREKACAGWIRELNKSVELFLVGAVLCLEYACILPLVLPFELGSFEIVILSHNLSILCLKSVCYEVGNIDLLCICPQMLEVVVISVVTSENVYKHRAVIK